MQTLKELTKYLYRILKNYIFLLGLLPLAYDYIQAYLSASFPAIANATLPQPIVYTILVLTFLASGFQAWRQEKNRADSLEDKISSGVNYKVFSKKDNLNPIRTTKLEEKILQLEQKETQNSKNHLFIPPVTLELLKYGRARSGDNIGDLKRYITEVKSYNKKIHGVKRVFLYIKNTGIKFDECINIHIQPLEGTEILSEVESQDISEPPEAPDEKEDFYGPLSMNLISPNRPPNALHRETTYLNDGSIDIEINRIRVGDSISIVYDGILYRGENFKFSIKIKSKNLPEPLVLALTNKENETEK